MPTRLWERWSRRRSGACPFGVIVRPAKTGNAGPPFPAEEYRPRWLPSELRIYMAAADLEEPMWVFMPFLRASDRGGFAAHPNGICEITRIAMTTPAPLQSSAARVMIENAVLLNQQGPEYLLSIEFDGGLHELVQDLRPHIPIALRV